MVLNGHVISKKSVHGICSWTMLLTWTVWRDKCDHEHNKISGFVFGVCGEATLILMNLKLNLNLHLRFVNLYCDTKTPTWHAEICVYRAWFGLLFGWHSPQGCLSGVNISIFVDGISILLFRRFGFGFPRKMRGLVYMSWYVPIV